MKNRGKKRWMNQEEEMGKKTDKIDMAKEYAWETTISRQDGVIGIDPWCQENLPYSTGRSLCLLPIFLAQHRRFYRAGGGTEASDGVTLREVLGVMNSVGKSQESSTVQKQIKQQGSNRQWHSTETKKSSSLNQEEWRESSKWPRGGGGGEQEICCKLLNKPLSSKVNQQVVFWMFTKY